MKASTTIYFVLTLLIHNVQPMCIPCPSGKFEFSLPDCPCEWGQFYDSTTQNCVAYSECPVIKKYNPLPNLTEFAPMVFDVFTNSVDQFVKPKKSFLQTPKDLSLIVRAVQKRIEIIKKQLPSILGPVIAPIIMKNKGILSDCRAKAYCVVVEALKKKENYNIIIPHMKPILIEIMNEFLNVIDDLEEVAKDCSYSSGCPLIRAILDVRNVAPHTVQNLKNLSVIMVEIFKYLIGDVDEYIEDYLPAK